MLQVDAGQNDKEISDKKRHKSNSNGSSVGINRLRSNGNVGAHEVPGSSGLDRSLLEHDRHKFNKSQVLQVVHQFLQRINLAQSQGLEEASRALQKETGLRALDAVDQRLTMVEQELHSRNPRLARAADLLGQYRRSLGGSFISRQTELLDVQFALLTERLLQILFEKGNGKFTAAHEGKIASASSVSVQAHMRSDSVHTVIKAEFFRYRYCSLEICDETQCFPTMPLMTYATTEESRISCPGRTPSPLVDAAQFIREHISPLLTDACDAFNMDRESLEQLFSIQLISDNREAALSQATDVTWASLLGGSFSQTLRRILAKMEVFASTGAFSKGKLLSILAKGSSQWLTSPAVFSSASSALGARTVDLFKEVNASSLQELVSEEKKLLPTRNVQSFFCHADEVWCVEASRKGDKVVSAAKDGTIQIFHVNRDYNPRSSFTDSSSSHNDHNGTQSPDTHSPILSNGTSNGSPNNSARHIAGTTKSKAKHKKKSQLPKVGDGPLSYLHRIDDATPYEVFCIKWSPCDRYLVAGGSNGMLFLWELTEGSQSNGYKDSREKRRSAVAPKNSAGHNGLVHKAILEKQVHKHRVSSVVWCEPLSSRTEPCFISTGFECCCKLFNTKGEELASISCDGIQDMKWYKASPLTYPNKGETHEFICTASNRRHRIQRLTVDLREGLEPKLNIVPQFVEPSSSLDSLLDEEVTAEQLSSRLYAFKAFAAMHSLLVDGESHRVLVNVVGDLIYEYDLNSAKVRHMYTQILQDESVLRPCFSDASKRYLICGSDDGKIHMWDRHAGEAPVDPIVTLEGHSARANAVCVTETKDNHLVVVSASDDATVRVWTCGKAIDRKEFEKVARNRVQELYQKHSEKKLRERRLSSLRARQESSGSNSSGRRSGYARLTDGGAHPRVDTDLEDQAGENVAESDMTADDEDLSVDEDD